MYGEGGGSWLSELKWMGIGLQKTVTDYLNICKMRVCWRGGGWLSELKWAGSGLQKTISDYRYLNICKMHVYVGGGVTKGLEVGGEWAADDCLWLFKHLQKVWCMYCGGGLTKWIEVDGDWAAKDCYWLFKHLQNACVLGGEWLSELKWAGSGLQKTVSDYRYLNICKMCVCVCVWGGGGGEGGWLSEFEVGWGWAAEDCLWLF